MTSGFGRVTTNFYYIFHVGSYLVEMTSGFGRVTTFRRYIDVIALSSFVEMTSGFGRVTTKHQDDFLTLQKVEMTSGFGRVTTVPSSPGLP